jgi:hypothetical protein
MKARFWIVGKSSFSLRDALNADLARDNERPEDKKRFQMTLARQRKVTRSPGWSLVHSLNDGKGSIRYQWNRELNILECWAVTKGGNRPSQVIGEFIEAVLDSQRAKIKSIHIEVG